MCRDEEVSLWALERIDVTETLVLLNAFYVLAFVF